MDLLHHCSGTGYVFTDKMETVQYIIYLSIYLYSCCCHLESRASVKHFVSLQFLNLRQSVGSLGRGINQCKAAIYTGQHKHKKKTQANIHALSGIRTRDPNVRAGEIYIYINNVVKISLKAHFEL
jgi:hypothetical protein